MTSLLLLDEQRATAGLRRITAELTDGNLDNGSSGNNNSVNDSPTPIQPTDPVTMEITSSPPLTVMESENLVIWGSQEVEDLHYQEVHGLNPPIGNEQEKEQAAEKENVIRDADECDYLVFAIGELKGDDNGGESEGQEEERGGEEVQDGGRGATEGKAEGSGDTEREDGGRGDTKAEDECIETVGETKDDALSELFISCSPVCPSSSESLIVTSDPSEQPIEAILHEAWGHDLGNRDDLSDSHVSDCLQAELAIVYSDSDAGDDQWASFARCDVTNQEEAGGGTHNSICDGESKEEEREGHNKERGEGEEKAEVKSKTEEQREEELEVQERVGGRDGDDEEPMMSSRDLFLRSPSVSSTASSTDPDTKIAVDPRVPEETHSENVSTEHVDFLLARQQWRKMEEEVKGQPIPKPGLRAQGSFQGTHTSLYPPTRSPRLKHRETPPPVPRQPTLSPSSEDSGLEDLSYRSPLEEPESAVEREIRLTLEREERHRRERGGITQSLTIPRASTLTGRSPPRPPACRTPTLSISPSPSPVCSSSFPRSVYHEMTANNVIILEPDCSSSASRNRLLSSAIGGLSDWPISQDSVPSANVIVVETSNLIIRSASEFCLSSSPMSTETQESTFSSNPFFKLRSLSSQSLVEQEIRMVRQREEEWRRQREDMWRRSREEEWSRGRERYDTVLVSPGLSDNISYNVPEVLDRCVSSPSSPSRTRKMERSSMSCDHKPSHNPSTHLGSSGSAESPPPSSSPHPSLRCQDDRTPWLSDGRPPY
ncbi:apoptotic chromatin condensation inducer in the nucleus [Cyclopterus lumpus]|uniref:apoptotic chromatin condensation inducer in the nucleus n=1 Tax=Cyclopterus lumpus TaxID=8103 RepID=UPI001486F508|nr:apoptotic chromatin condensation inducer in the nucleus [Cyclopterus lumpus]